MRQSEPERPERPALSHVVLSNSVADGLEGGCFRRECRSVWSALGTSAKIAAAPSSANLQKRADEDVVNEFETNGLYWTERGRGAPLLLVHGSGPDADSWDACLDPLAGHGFRAIAYDRRGYSRSAGAATADLSRHAQDAAELLRRVDAVPATVVGASFGGLVALELALTEPAMVSHLVLFEAPLHGRKHPTPGLMLAFVASRLTLRMRGERAAALRFLRWVTSYRGGGSAIEDEAFPAARREQMAASASAMLCEQRVNDQDLTIERVASLGLPLTCVVGELSPSWFHTAMGTLTEGVPGASLRVSEGSGHAVGFDRPREFADLLAEVVHSEPVQA